jgi:TonB family protein
MAVILLIVATQYVAGQDTGLSEAKLKAQFEGKVVSLHHFYSEEFQRFDADGVAKEDYKTCPWTMCGKLIADKVSVSKSKVKIEGRRAWVLFKGEPRQISYAKSADRVEIAIDLGEGSDQEKRLNVAFSKIFLVGKQNFADDVPDFWKPIFEVKPAAIPTAGAPKVEAVAERPAEPAATTEKPKPPKRVRVSQGVTEGSLIHKVTPNYPSSARWTHITGTVVMAALIDKEGNIANLVIVKPVGGGLDEAAYEGVKQWKYKPYFLQGQPVEIDTQITVNFVLGQ